MNDLAKEMKEILKSHADKILSSHKEKSKTAQKSPPIKELTSALIDVSAALAVTFGCPKAKFVKMALDSYEEAERNKTMSLSSTVGGTNSSKKTLN